jgi:hypothetical protein
LNFIGLINLRHGSKEKINPIKGLHPSMPVKP